MLFKLKKTFLAVSLKQVVPAGSRVSIIGHDPEQPAVADPTWGDAIQIQPFCDSVNNCTIAV